ncbi:MAG: diguanylate cyclase [Gammaproteobacteria bacterium]|nr:diguanylate cyclase [Gammaproteobacteria bacterium]
MQYARNLIAPTDLVHINAADALELTQRIHRKIEFEPLLELLLAYGSALAPVVGIEYRHGDLAFNLARTGRHSLVFNLEHDEQDVGSLTLTSRKTLDDDEIEHLEDLIALAITAIANAVKFHDAVRRNVDTASGSSTAKPGNDAVILVAVGNVEDLQQSLGASGAHDVISDLGVFLRDNLRAADDVYQIGDDEIAILLPDTDDGHATAVAQKLRILITARTEELELEGIYVAPTLGVASTVGAQSAQEVLRRAREALSFARVGYDAHAITH